MNKKQAIEYLQTLKLILSEVSLPYEVNVLAEAIAALDDTHEGFSNRETWATYVHITNTPSWLADLYDKETGDGIKAWFDNCFEELLAMGDENTVRAALDIGSLWRVNWDEVAAALGGGE